MEIVERLRQGDMLIYRISEAEAAKIKAKSKKIDLTTLTVGVGEVTGHSHDVLMVGNEGESKVTAYLEKENDTLDNIPAIKNLFFELEKAGMILHDEHNPIHLEKGFYVRVNQREYNPFTQMHQQVRD